MFGCNDNPSAQHLESAWRKLLGQHQITASESANCVNNDFTFLSVLNASSRKKNASSRKKEEKGMKEIFENNNIVSLHDLDEEDFPFHDDNSLASFESHHMCYIASVIQTSITEGRWHSPVTCKLCLNIFSEDQLLDDEFVALKMKSSKLNAPAKSVVEICKATENSLKKFNYESGKFNEILKETLTNLNLAQLFWMSDFKIHGEDGHKIKMITLIIQMCVFKKQVYISKCNTLAAHDSFLRSKLKKLIHFKGQ